jgi:hypothetical protein
MLNYPKWWWRRRDGFMGGEVEGGEWERVDGEEWEMRANEEAPEEISQTSTWNL